jgi:hypothetical protein
VSHHALRPRARRNRPPPAEHYIIPHIVVAENKTSSSLSIKLQATMERKKGDSKGQSHGEIRLRRNKAKTSIE